MNKSFYIVIRYYKEEGIGEVVYRNPNKDKCEFFVQKHDLYNSGVTYQINKIVKQEEKIC